MRSMNTQGKAVKVDVPGSDKSYPFVLEGEKDSGTVCVFESPIEAMNYRTLCKITGSGRLSCPMISLGGPERREKDSKTIRGILYRIPPLSVSGRLERRAEGLQAQFRRETSNAAMPGTAACCLKIGGGIPGWTNGESLDARFYSVPLQTKSSHWRDIMTSRLSMSIFVICMYTVEPPCTERYARRCERSAASAASYSI